MQLPTRSQVKKGAGVYIETRQDRGTGRLTRGVVGEILTPGETHPYGIMVLLADGQKGRVRQVLDGEGPVQAGAGHAGPGAAGVPRAEDRQTEFKEFYQYDPKMDGLLSDPGKNKAAINGMRESAQERIAVAVSSLGNSDGGSVYIGVKSDGTVSGLDRDMEFGGFADYTDSFANSVRDMLGRFLQNKAFITARISIQFPEVEGRTICVIGVGPSNEPLFLHKGGEIFYVRGPAPRAEKLEGQDQFKYIRGRFPDFG